MRCIRFFPVIRPPRIFAYYPSRYCSEAPSASSSVTLSEAPQPPTPFTALHETGTNYFEVVGEMPSGVHVLCCSILESRDRRRPDPGKRPLLWSATITRGMFSMDVTCSTLMSSVLSVDGIAFYDTPTEAFEHSPSAHINRMCTYQGPNLHQGTLAALAVGVPILDTVHPQRQSAMNWYNPYQGTHTKYTKYDHVPVHTISPDLLESIVLYLNSVGINDALATFMEEYRNYVLQQERRIWFERAQDVLPQKHFQRK
eukprot:PhF_6_TR22711/c0_g1_i1/m.32352